MEENSWNEKFAVKEELTDNSDDCQCATAVSSGWQPSDYDIRNTSFTYASSLFAEANVPKNKKLENIMEAAKVIEHYFRTGEVKITYEK